jgi:hypothetical protein
MVFIDGENRKYLESEITETIHFHLTGMYPDIDKKLLNEILPVLSNQTVGVLLRRYNESKANKAA